MTPSEPVRYYLCGHPAAQNCLYLYCVRCGRQYGPFDHGATIDLTCTCGCRTFHRGVRP